MTFCVSFIMRGGGGGAASCGASGSDAGGGGGGSSAIFQMNALVGMASGGAGGAPPCGTGSDAQTVTGTLLLPDGQILQAGAGGAAAMTGGNAGLIILAYSSPTGVCSL